MSSPPSATHTSWTAPCESRARTAYRVARPGDLIDAARTVFPDAATVLARYGAR